MSSRQPTRSRKIDPNRPRRHMARSTPDEVRTRFDAMDDNAKYKYEDWIKQFGKQMKIKHGGAVHINVYMEENGRYPGEILVIARVEQ